MSRPLVGIEPIFIDTLRVIAQVVPVRGTVDGLDPDDAQDAETIEALEAYNEQVPLMTVHVWGTEWCTSSKSLGQKTPENKGGFLTDARLHTSRHTG